MKLNKDGTPRKKGSGRTKGSTSFVTYTLKQLIDQLPEGTKVVANQNPKQKNQLKKPSPRFRLPPLISMICNLGVDTHQNPS